MKLLINFVLFFGVFLPLTYVVGVPGNYWVGRYQDPSRAPTIYHWISVGWPLIVPSVLWVPLGHALIASLARCSEIRSPATWRVASLAMWPLGFLGVHLALYGMLLWSIPLLVTFSIPGVIYGVVARIPVRWRVEAAPSAE